jgi:cytochrome c biogenesis protein CcdA
VIDPVGAAISAAAAQSLWAPLLAFGAGIASSAGPCIAPRFVAVTALAGAPGAARWKSIAAFAAGLCASYVLLGIAAGLLSRVAAVSGNLYAFLAILLLALGLHALLTDPARHRCSGPRSANGSLGAAFLLGGSSALIVSPCCAPVVVTLGSLTAARSSVTLGAVSIAAYALGHAVPLALAGFGWNAIGTRIDAGVWKSVSQMVGGGLMLALAGYYAVLA